MGSFRQLVMYRMTKHEDHIWFFNQTYSAIIEIALNNMVPQIVWMEEGEEFFSDRKYGGVARYENRLIFAPRCADNILIYEIDTRKIKRVYIDISKIDQTYSVFSDVHIYGEYAFFFPGRYKAILKMNINTYEIQYITDCVNEVGILPNPQFTFFSKCRVVSERICLMPCWQKGIVLKFDMETENWWKYNLGRDGISDISFDGHSYWISNKDKPEIFQTSEDFEIIRKHNCAYNSKINNKGYLHILDGGDNLYLIPFLGTGIAKWGKNNHNIRLIESESGQCESNMKDINSEGISVFFSYKDTASIYFLFDAMRGVLSAFNTMEDIRARYPLCLDKYDIECVRDRFLKHLLKGNIMVESGRFNLKEFFLILGD